MSHTSSTTTAHVPPASVQRRDGRRNGLAGFIGRHPLTAFFAWFFTVGQAFAFTPVVFDTGVPQVFIIGSTLVGLLLPALVITRIADGPEGLRELWRRAVDVRVSLGWYAFALLVVPLVTFGIVLALDGAPTGMSASTLGSVLLGNLLLPFLLTWLPNNWWEEVAWMGFVQARLQHRHGPWLAALIVGPLFAVQHVALVADRSLAEGVLLITLLAVFAVGFRFVAGWVYNRTAGLFIVGLVHGIGNAVTGGSGFQEGLLARLYPESPVATMSHLLAFLLIGLVIVAVTRGRLGMRTAGPER